MHVGRILALLSLLEAHPEGMSRDEIFQAIPEYTRNVDDLSKHKMLRRDLNALTRGGILVPPMRGHKNPTFRILDNSSRRA